MKRKEEDLLKDNINKRLNDARYSSGKKENKKNKGQTAAIIISTIVVIGILISLISVL
ncbi:hypothetical protein FC19_GL002155 [Liquorilactobacillus aquaticus DSM 21051]|uniref:Accessory secretory protein Asp4 n=1 Tax=Liquorilactobacillus aquaticus DSM 21051 TaxID=1423725 RepID=A0A0R2CTT9_9LACO|nr:hypothetical protein [Liquorilactobacillus aquaticus]KRM95063.1 hypothetical protein FC19_GL002155 [Liquorilactobacillus aquaticus DSM 21051]